MPETNLTLQDIAIALQIIDIASSRGAIRGDEMATVGQCRNNLATFLKAAQEAQAAQVDTETVEKNEE